MRHAGQVAAGISLHAPGSQGDGGHAAGPQRLHLIDPAPIGGDEFAALMAPFDADRRVVVAVSGGGDSMALAVLASRWGDPLAVVVDHGLRPDSAAEAALTAARLTAIGVPSRVVRAELLAGPAAAERARTARYQLLLGLCREAGRTDLLLAHHAGDQAETVRLRQDRFSGIAGLAGMAAVDYRAEARLLRPLLSLSPDRLRATLRIAGVAWVEDPTNTDLRTGRGRLRAAFPPQERAESLRIGDDAAMARALSERLDAGRLAGASIRPEGFAIVPFPIGASALSSLIWTISGRRHPPPSHALTAGLATRTMHGVLLHPAGRLGDGTLVAREPAAIAEPVPARDGAVWDGRFRLSGPVPPGLELGGVGVDAPSLRSRSPLPAVVVAGLPTLRRDGALWAVPHLDFPDAATCRSVRLDFWPARPAVPAPFVRCAVNPSVSRGV